MTDCERGHEGFQCSPGPTCHECFNDIVAGLEDELDEYEAEDLTTLTPLELMDRLHTARHDMLTRGVALEPKTPEDMEKQSLYFGLVAEMRRRKLM